MRTINGYISRAGSPAQVYVDGVNFSILVQDSKGSMVYSFPDGTSISPNASGVIYDPAGTGAIPTNVQEMLRRPGIDVRDYGAVGDGTTNDLQALKNARDAAGDSACRSASVALRRARGLADLREGLFCGSCTNKGRCGHKHLPKNRATGLNGGLISVGRGRG